MCVSIPARVVSIRGHEATLDVMGAARTASTMLLPEVQVGDYVLTSAGLISSILDEDDAQASIALFEALIALEMGEEPNGS